METKQTVDSILEAVREELTQFVETESEISSAITYEERVLEIAMKFARETIRKSSGKLPKSRNKKKIVTTFGKLILKKDHKLSQGTSKFGISARMQEMMCLLGQSMVFEEASETIGCMMKLDISASQIQRVSSHHGSALDPLIKANCEAVIPEMDPSNKNEVSYIMLDGSMLYTREDQWREIKLGRIFRSSQVAEIQENRREILQSIYVSHLGSVDEFFPKFERYLVPYKNKVILGDGAKWIWNWAEDNYPGATKILDFYHAKEKLVLFAKQQFRDDEKRKSWIKEQSDKLLDDGLEQVIQILRATRSRTKESKKAKQKAIAYYLEHDDKMQYKTYRKQGYLIGSGPIEAAHRSVIQQRMKLSGQKWSIGGANAIANLRCYKHSGAWGIIRKIITVAA